MPVSPCKAKIQIQQEVRKVGQAKPLFERSLALNYFFVSVM